MSKRGYTGEELLSAEFKDPPVLIDGMLWEQDAIIVLGDAKTGKSLFSLQIACSLTSGHKFLDEYYVRKPCNVLYLQAEGKIAESASRYRKMSHEIISEPKKLRWLYLPSVPMDREGSARQLLDVIKQEFGDFKPDVIIFDPLYKLATTGSLSADEVAGRITTNLDVLKHHLEAAIIVDHHEHCRKTNPKTGEPIAEGDRSIFGSFIWRGWPDHILHFRATSEKGRSLSCKTQRSGAVIRNLPLYFQEPDPLYFEIAENASETQHLIHMMLKSKKKVAISELITTLGKGESTIYRVLRRLCLDGKAQKSREPGIWELKEGD
jgi:RecA-family ATPase